MSGRRCARLWQAEAVHDGQFVGIDAASFARHAATCEQCSAEVRALASLAERMCVVDLPDPSPLELRRLRLSVLERAHARRSVRQAPRAARAAWAVAALLLVAVVVGVSLHLAGRPPAPAPIAGPSQAVAPVFDVVNVAGAVVTSRTEDGTTRAQLTDGVAAFHVAHLASPARFVVVLPDGELEVRGTRFVVAVRDGRTQDVEVTEGVVLLRLGGDDEQRLEAGQRWSLSRAIASPGTTSAPDVHRSALPPGRAPSRAASAPPPSLPAPSPQPPATRLAATERFARAMATFQSGRYAEADSLLASFANDFPVDARAEDVAFLRAVAHSRMGDRSGAAVFARQYLTGFPQGLRRREAEQLVREGAAP